MRGFQLHFTELKTITALLRPRIGQDSLTIHLKHIVLIFPPLKWPNSPIYNYDHHCSETYEMNCLMNRYLPNLSTNYSPHCMLQTFSNKHGRTHR
jgi:hypothetical protein